MAQSKKKPMFHKPQKTGIIRKIPTSLPMKIISYVALAALLGLTVFAVIAIINKGQEFVPLSGTFAMKGVFLYIFLPLIAWIIAMGFRLAVRFIPLEMWRLPMSIRESTIKTEGKYLKFATLLIELETTIMLGYITFTLYNGQIPGDLPILIWVAAVVATIIFFGRYVGIAAERIK